MSFTEFELVKWQSQNEESCKYSLADSGCLPVKLSDVIYGDNFEKLLGCEQNYGVIAGSGALREQIADWHGAKSADVLVTVGGTEANAIAIDALIQPNEHAVFFTPGYPQHIGCLLNRKVRLSTVELDAKNDWCIHAEQLNEAVQPDTKLIVISNPNTPTGSILTDSEMSMVIAAAEKVGAWLLVDEVHRGTEFNGISRTFWGLYDRVVCISSMSKAFGLPGIRVGWLIAPPELRKRAERRHEYATIATAKLSTHLAELAFTDPVKQQLLNRTQDIIREGYVILKNWVRENSSLVSMVNPQATAAGFVRYHIEAKSLEIAQSLLIQGGVLVIPGAHFGSEHHLRITYGVDPIDLAAALDRISSILVSFKRGNNND